jgi:hypothetical protein
MSHEHLAIAIPASVIALVLVLWLVAAIVNRPKTPEHDLRRRALAIVAGFGGIPIGAAAIASAPVAVAMVIAWAAVVIAGLYLVLRSPPL